MKNNDFEAGDPAPDFTLPLADSQALADSQPITLSEVWQAGQPVLLVFLRHLG